MEKDVDSRWSAFLAKPFVACLIIGMVGAFWHSWIAKPTLTFAIAVFLSFISARFNKWLGTKPLWRLDDWLFPFLATAASIAFAWVFHSPWSCALVLPAVLAGYCAGDPVFGKKTSEFAEGVHLAIGALLICVGVALIPTPTVAFLEWWDRRWQWMIWILNIGALVSAVCAFASLICPWPWLGLPALGVWAGSIVSGRRPAMQRKMAFAFAVISILELGRWAASHVYPHPNDAVLFAVTSAMTYTVCVDFQKVHQTACNFNTITGGKPS